MEQENLVPMKKEKKGLNVLVVILLALLVGIIMFIVGQYTSNKTNLNIFKNNSNETSKNENNTVVEDNSSTNESNTIAEDNQTKEDDSITNDTKILEEITKVYEEAYHKLDNFEDRSNSILQPRSENNDIVYSLNRDLASKYFTDKGIHKLERISSHIDDILSTLFNETNSGVRPLKIVSKNNDIVVATGQIITAEENVSKDLYPLYIVFKKINDTYKIDMFE